MKITSSGRSVIAVAAGIVVGAAAVAGGTAAIAAVGATVTAYAQNASGETYGSAAAARSFESEPELIAAIATNGTQGYVRKADLQLPVVRTPEEAAAVTARSEKGYTIPVVDSDGKKVLGEFLIGGESGRELGEDGAASAR